MREEIPTKADTTFLISPAPVAVEGGVGGGGAKVEEALVVFCIDISGSMCVTTEVRSVAELKHSSLTLSLSLSLSLSPPPFLPLSLSPSLSLSVQVPGKFELKGHDRVKDLSSLNVHQEDQYLPRQRRDVTYVSRLQVQLLLLCCPSICMSCVHCWCCAECASCSGPAVD